MTKLLLVLALLGAYVYAQPSSIAAAHIQFGASLPSVCSPVTGDIFYINTGGSLGPYYCSATNTWTALGSSGGGDTITSPNATISIGGSSSNTTLDLASCSVTSSVMTCTNALVAPSFTVSGSNPFIKFSSNTTHTGAAGDLWNNAGALQFGATPVTLIQSGVDINSSYQVVGILGHNLYPDADSTSLAIGVGALASQSTTTLYNLAVGAGALSANTTASENNAFGYNALHLNTTGTNNAAFGTYALSANTTGIDNTAFGTDALTVATTASYNAAFGEGALNANTTGFNNTALGQQSLFVNVTGHDNVAVGQNSLYTANSPNYNTAVGSNSMQALTTGNSNTCVGEDCLYTLQTGNANVAVGFGAAYFETGNYNTAVGYNALQNSTSDYNTAFGYQALQIQTSATNNSAFGENALGLATGSNNTAMGAGAGSAVTSGGYNVFIGKSAGSNGTVNTTTGSTQTLIGQSTQAGASGDSNETAIGNSAVGNGSNTVTLGNSSVTDMYVATGGAIIHGTPSILGTSTGTATIKTGLTGSSSYNYTIPSTSANDTFCLVTAANCAGVQPDSMTICESGTTISQCTLTGTLTSLQVLGLNTSPVTVLAAPGAGIYALVDSATFELVYGGTAYTFSGIIAVDVGTVAATGNCASSLLTVSQNEICVALATAQLNSVSTLTNQAISIKASSNPTLGTGTLNYWIKYRLLSGF